MSDNKDWGSPASTAANFTDLVPEFEPGKPWKVNFRVEMFFGTQCSVRNVELF